MENAIEALKIAFAVMMLVLALGLSMSSFSNARLAADSIIEMSDREKEYTYIEPSDDLLTRTVGIETIIPAMYRAYTENIEIYFYESDGTTPLYLYYKTDSQGERVKKSDGSDEKINYIDLSLENFATSADAIKHLDILIGAEDTNNTYEKQIMHTQGLYEYFKGKTFTETLGEYYQGTGAAKIKKRVITYKLQ